MLSQDVTRSNPRERLMLGVGHIPDCLSSELGVLVRMASYSLKTYTGQIIAGESFAPAWYVDPSSAGVTSIIDFIEPLPTQDLSEAKSQV